MITIRELTRNPARDIVEGRKRLVPVATVAYVAFRAPVARAAQAVENAVPFNVPAGGHSSSAGGRTYQHFAPYVESFHATDPGEFRTVDFARHERLHGWVGENHAMNNLLQKRKERGQLQVVRKQGKSVIWRFAQLDPNKKHK